STRPEDSVSEISSMAGSARPLRTFRRTVSRASTKVNAGTVPIISGEARGHDAVVVVNRREVQSGPGIDRVAAIDIHLLPATVGDGARQRAVRACHDHVGRMPVQGLLPSGASPVKAEDLVYPGTRIGDFVAAINRHANRGI